MEQSFKTQKSTLKRHPERGHYDKETIHKILDEGFVCHVGFIFHEKAFVLPTGYGRIGNTVYIHGSMASMMLKAGINEPEITISVTLLDGLVLAKSAFSHSFNYRSVVIFGKARLVDDPEEKINALYALTEQVIPGRWNEVRTPNDKEMKQTLVLAVNIEEASAKIRQGDPNDNNEDLSFPVWAGVLPLTLKAGQPIPASYNQEGLKVPDHVTGYRNLSNFQPGSMRSK